MFSCFVFSESSFETDDAITQMYMDNSSEERDIDELIWIFIAIGIFLLSTCAAVVWRRLKRRVTSILPTIPEIDMRVDTDNEEVTIYETPQSTPEPLPSMSTIRLTPQTISPPCSPSHSSSPSTEAPSPPPRNPTEHPDCDSSSSESTVYVIPIPDPAPVIPDDPPVLELEPIPHRTRSGRIYSTKL